MLELDQLVLRRGDLTWRHHFNLSPGRCAAVMGPSGSGKTTLLEALGGFVPAEKGEIRLDGERLNDLPAERRPVSTLFQAHNLFEHIGVTDNLRLGFEKGRPSASEWQSVEEASQALGVSSLLGCMPGELSGGQRQRIALIRTVLRPQPVILLDEPFSALDADNRELAGNWLVDVVRRTGKMALFVTHLKDDADRWADDTVLL